MSPKIYVASLSDYNNGILHGAWIDATQSADEIHAEIQEMLKASPQGRTRCLTCGRHILDHGGLDAVKAGTEHVPFPGSDAEEWAIHDYEDFGAIKVGEFEDIERISKIAEMLNDYGDAFSAYVDNIGVDYVEWDNAATQFEDAYQGEFESAADYAQQTAEDAGYFSVYDNDRYGMPKPHDLSGQWPFTCIDWERAARELELGGDIWTAPANGAVYVFNGNI